MKRIRRTFMFERDSLKFIERLYENKRKLCKAANCFNFGSRSDIIDIALVQLEKHLKEKQIIQ